MKTRRFGVILLALVLAVCCMLSVTSCKKHKHTYASTVTPPTCESQGYTTHTCTECGDSYRDSYVDNAHTLKWISGESATCVRDGWGEYECTACGAHVRKDIPKGKHNYYTEVVTYPTVTESGVKNLICADCGHRVENREIAALAVALPNASDMLSDVIKGAKYTLSVTKGSNLFMLTEYSGSGAPTKNELTRINVQLLEAVIDDSGSSFAGHLRIEITGIDAEYLPNTKPQNATSNINHSLSLSLYVKGDNVSVEISGSDMESTSESISLTEAFYTALYDRMGMEGMTVYSTMSEALAILGQQIGNIDEENPLGFTESYLNTLDSIGEKISEDILVEEDIGSGITQYTLNFNALCEVLKLVEGKTIKAVIDDAYGSGTADSIASFIKGVPDMTLNRVASTVIAFAEDYGVSADDLYALLDYMVRSSGSDEEFSIEKEIKSRYHMTIVELLSEDNPDFDKKRFIEGFETIADNLLTYTVDQLYQEAFYPEESGTKLPTLSEDFKEAMDILSENVSLVICERDDGSFTVEMVNGDYEFFIGHLTERESETKGYERNEISISYEGEKVFCIESGSTFVYSGDEIVSEESSLVLIVNGYKYLYASEKREGNVTEYSLEVYTEIEEEIPCVDEYGYTYYEYEVVGTELAGVVYLDVTENKDSTEYHIYWNDDMRRSDVTLTVSETTENGAQVYRVDYDIDRLYVSSTNHINENYESYDALSGTGTVILKCE